MRTNTAIPSSAIAGTTGTIAATLDRESGLAWVQNFVPTIILIAILMLSVIGLSPIAVVGPDPSDNLSGDGDSLKQAGFVFVFLAIAWRASATGGLQQLLRIPLALVVVLSWCWLSLLWAVNPAISFRRLILTTLVIVSISQTVQEMLPRTITKVLVGTFIVILIADWISIPLFHYAIHQPTEIEPELAGDWRGFHLHKNEAGGFFAIAVIVFIDVAYRARSRIFVPFMIMAASGFLYFTHSKTSEGFLFVAMLIGLLAQKGYSNRTLRVIMLLTAIGAALITFSVDAIPYDQMDTTMDDPAAFTGRTQIWPVLMRFAGDHFLLGSGYGSFWDIGDDSPIYAYSSKWVTTVFEGHNGYLDLQVQIGFVGSALAVSLLVIRPFYILFFRPLRSDVSRWLLCSILSFGFLRDLLESSLLDRANPIWVIILVVYILLENTRLRARDVEIKID